MEKTLIIGTVKTTELVRVYNELTGKDIKRFTDRATAEARVNLILVEQKKVLTGNPEAVVIADVETAPPAEAPRKASHNDAWTITLVAEKNPKREGSDAFARFALYKTGMTIREYLTACEGLGQTLKGKPMPGFRFRADLKWDEDHGFITISK